MKEFVGNPCVLCFRKFPVATKFMDKKGGSLKTFRRNFFCVTVAKIFIGELFSVPLYSGIELYYASEGYVTIFRRKFYVSQ